MLLFRSEEDVAAWCKERGVDQGAVLPLDQVWTLSQLWYSDRLNEEFHGRTVPAAIDIFKQAGLAGPFWEWGDGG